VTGGRVCVVGSFMMDLVLRAPRRPATGETVIGTSFETFLGGKGFNQAIAAARAGATTTMVGRVGNDDFGRQFLECLAAEAIDNTYVSADETEGTGVGMPLVEESGENSIVVVPRANSNLSPADIQAASAAIAGADVLLLQLELPMDVVVAAARIAHDAGVLVVLNPAPAPVDGNLEALRGLVDVIVPNEHEARMLGDAHHLGDAHQLGDAEAVDRLVDRFSTSVVMTVGGSGCVGRDGATAFSVTAHQVDVVDTVGAGDAFCGALGAWIAAGDSLRDAVLHANAAGALAVTKAGAEPSMPRRDAIVRLVASRPGAAEASPATALAPSSRAGS
jgi:ribokinase